MPNTEPPRILIVDGDPARANMFAAYLAPHRLEVRVAGNGAETRRIVGGFRPDVVLLDLTLPGESGLDLATWLVGPVSGVVPPAILFLSSHATPFERVLGLEVSGDDLLDMPLSPRELLARLRGALRRLGRPLDMPRLVRLGAVAVDFAARAIVRTDGSELALSAGEFALLRCFLDHPGRIFTRDDLLDRAPVSDMEPGDRAIDRRIARLRRKIEADGEAVIEAVRGQGYRLVAGAARTA